MSRPVAGVRKETLIITLPGSPKGAKENLEAVLKLLPHACIQAAGANSRAIHVGGVKKLEKEAGLESGLASVVPKKSEGIEQNEHRSNLYAMYMCKIDTTSSIALRSLSPPSPRP